MKQRKPAAFIFLFQTKCSQKLQRSWGSDELLRVENKDLSSSRSIQTRERPIARFLTILRRREKENGTSAFLSYSQPQLHRYRYRYREMSR